MEGTWNEIARDIQMAERQLDKIMKTRGRKKKKKSSLLSSLTSTTPPPPADPAMTSTYDTTIDDKANDDTIGSDGKDRSSSNKPVSEIWKSQGGWGRITSFTQKIKRKRTQPKSAAWKKARARELKNTMLAASSKPTNIRGRLYQQIDDIRSSPLARSALLKLASHHVTEAREKNKQLVLWNAEREILRRSAVRKARVEWIDEKSCRIPGSSASEQRSQKWWVLLQLGRTVNQIPVLIAKAKEEKRKKLQRVERMRQRVKRKARGAISNDVNSHLAAAAAATMVVGVAQSIEEEEKRRVEEEKEQEKEEKEKEKEEKQGTKEQQKQQEQKEENGQKEQKEHPETASNNPEDMTMAIDAKVSEVASVGETLSNSKREAKEDEIRESTNASQLSKSPSNHGQAPTQDSPSSDLSKNNQRRRSQSEGTDRSNRSSSKKKMKMKMKRGERTQEEGLTADSGGAPHSFAGTTKFPVRSASPPAHSLSRVNVPATASTLFGNFSSSTASNSSAASSITTTTSIANRSTAKSLDDVDPTALDQYAVWAKDPLPEKKISRHCSDDEPTDTSASMSSIHIPLDPRLFMMSDFDWCKRSKNQKPLLPKRGGWNDSGSGWEGFKKDVQADLSQVRDPLIEKAARIASDFGVDLATVLVEQNVLRPSPSAEAGSDMGISDEKKAARRASATRRRASASAMRRASVTDRASAEDRASAARRASIMRRTDTRKEAAAAGRRQSQLLQQQQEEEQQQEDNDMIVEGEAGAGEQQSTTTMTMTTSILDMSHLEEEEGEWLEQMRRALSSMDPALSRDPRSSYDRVTVSLRDVCRVRRLAIKHTSIIILDSARRHHALYFQPPTKHDPEAESKAETEPRRPLERPVHSMSPRTSRIFVLPARPTPVKRYPHLYEPYVDGGGGGGQNGVVRTRDRLREVRELLLLCCCCCCCCCCCTRKMIMLFIRCADH